MSIILQSFRLMQRQFATHLQRPIVRRFPPANKSISQQGFLSSLPRAFQPRIGGQWSMIPKPSIRPSVFHNAPIISSAFQNILPIRNPVLGNRPTTENVNFQQPALSEYKLENQEEEDMLYNRISRWSNDVALALTPQSSFITQEVQLTDQVIHDLVAHRFVFPILTPDDL